MTWETVPSQDVHNKTMGHDAKTDLISQSDRFQKYACVTLPVGKSGCGSVISLSWGNINGGSGLGGVEMDFQENDKLKTPRRWSSSLKEINR